MIFLSDTLVGVRQFLYGGRFDAYGTGKVNYTFMKNTILVIAEELGTSGYNTSMNEERNKGAFVMDAESMDISRLFGSGGNDQIASGENRQFESSRNRQ